MVGEDDRFRLEPAQGRQGVRRNFERALGMVDESAELVALADQSDSWHPQKLSRLIRALSDRAALAYSELRLLDPHQRPLTTVPGAARGVPSLTIESLAEHRLVPGSAAVFRRRLLDVALPFPDHLDLRHDQWLALCAVAEGGIARVHEPLTERWETRLDRVYDGHVSSGTGLPRLRRRRRHALLRKREARAAEVRSVLEDRIAIRSAVPRRTPSATRLAISVEGVSKTFPIPVPLPRTLAGRLRHPLATYRRDRLPALQDVTFEVRRGEFFGIAGANGSGKTTLLQILANVYKPDSGRVLIAPRVVPIISLGIGFQPDLPALPNVLATAELLGVRAAEAERKFEQLLEFAELTRFADLKLRNYSTGMRVRLAFATAMLVDADVLLLDEILAVGDASFRERARAAFEELRRDKTVVLVTHNMSYIQNYCDRALLLNQGGVEIVGEPAEIARRYAELALEQHGASSDLPALAASPAVEPRAEISDLWIADGAGRPTASLSAGEDIRLHATVAASQRIHQPGLRFEIRRRGAALVFAPPALSLTDRPPGLRPGSSLEVETAVENKLAPGAYTAVCTVTATRNGNERSVSPARTVDFAVAAGEAETKGIIDLEHSYRVRPPRREPGPAPQRRKR